MTKTFFITCMFFSLINCGYQGSGLLGVIKVYHSSCSLDDIKKDIDTCLALHKEVAVPDKFSNQINWDERGFDFLTHWTIYVNHEKIKMIWFSLIESDTPGIGVRAVYINSNWIYAKNMDDVTKTETSELFEDKILKYLKCF